MTAHPQTQSASIQDFFRLDGRVAIVTGAGSGLGAGIAVALAESGADVVITGRRPDPLTSVAEDIRRLGRHALPVPTDVTDPEQCDASVRATMKEFGRVDVLVNNAGVTHTSPATRERPDDFRSVLDVNLLGSYWMAQACAGDGARLQHRERGQHARPDRVVTAPGCIHLEQGRCHWSDAGPVTTMVGA